MLVYFTVHVQSLISSLILQKLEASSTELEQFERDIFSLRQELSARGTPNGSRLTASLEAELRHVQERAGQLQRSRGELVRSIHYLRGERGAFIISEVRGEHSLSQR